MEVGTFVMAGHSRSKNGVASLAYVPAIHVFRCANKARRGCPAPVYANRLRPKADFGGQEASTGLVSVRRSFSEGGHKAGHDESGDIVDRLNAHRTCSP